MAKQKLSSEMLLAELIGTFGLTFAVLISLTSPVVGLATPLIAAITLAVLVLVIGPISDCHINPAITLAQFFSGKSNLSTTVAYIIAQVSGALLALVGYGLFNNNEVFELGATQTWSAFWGEALGAGIFGFAVGAAVFNKLDAVASSIVVGGGLFIGIITASVASNAVLNPAVALGIGSATWPYLLGPILGAVVGMQIYKLLTPKKTK